MIDHLPAAQLVRPPIATVLRCDLEYEVLAPSHFIFNIQCAYSPEQHLASEAFTTSPVQGLEQSCDPLTGSRFIRCNAQPGMLRVRYDATVHVHRPDLAQDDDECEVADIPDQVLRYLMPSRFCPSDTMSQEARFLFGHLPRGRQRVESICQWIRDNISYQVGTSNPTTTALDVYLQKTGVCRDFGHLAITFCRALNIPARLVGGYGNLRLPPQDFHAIVEVWLGGRWKMFDPTLLMPAEKLVRVATGLDAKNTAFATIYGSMVMTYMHLQVNHDGTAVSEHPDRHQATVARMIPTAA